jgi:hypothetical protein
MVIPGFTGPPSKALFRFSTEFLYPCGSTAGRVDFWVVLRLPRGGPSHQYLGEASTPFFLASMVGEPSANGIVTDRRRDILRPQCVLPINRKWVNIKSVTYGENSTMHGNLFALLINDK